MSTPNNMNGQSDSADERKRRLDEVLARYLQRIDSGEFVDRAEFVAEHPDLAIDIEAFLNDQDAVGGLIHPEETVEFAATPHSRSRSRGLHIRCPHCTNPVELLVDTPYEEITCHSCGSHFSLVDREEATRQATPLESIGRFELISRLGVGGFGSVWKARDSELDRIVAVKIPRKGQLSPAEIEQFFREARSAAQLRHPNIVPVHEVGRAEDTIFIVCELIRGVEMTDWLTGGQRTFREISAMCRKIAGALHHAHQQGVIHRDLKPSNIMVDLEGEPNLMDFGLAKREVGEVTMTIDGQVLGTPAYMSPEQAGGRSHWTDRRTDIYSLGVVLFRLLTGELPYRGNAQMQVHQRQIEDAPDPRKLNRHIPKDLATVCLKCLERDPNRRYSTAQQLADEFDRFEKGMPIEARPISRAARAVRWAKRKPTAALSLGLLAVLAVAGPTAASMINVQRRRAESLVVEKNNVIERYIAEQEAAQAQVANLRSSLDAWEGRANPWEFWPPSRTVSPAHLLIEKWHPQHFDAVAAKLDASPRTFPTALGRMALAMTARESGRPDAALEQYRLAEAILSAMQSRQSNDPGILAALADCSVALAEMQSKQSPDKANASMDRAADLYDQLAAQQDASPLARLALLDVTLRQATDAGFEEGKQLLNKAEQISRTLEGSWPTEPERLYAFACRLCGKEPVTSAYSMAAESIGSETAAPPAP